MADDSIDRIVQALAPYFANFSGWETARINAGEAAAAVLAVLPQPADRAAVLRQEAALIRAHCPDHLDSQSAEGSWINCHCDVADDMERRATQAQQPAHPPTHAWRVETRDPGTNQWMEGSHFAHRPAAVERWETANRTAPLWNDGTPVERRIVRETTTYTVDQPAETPKPDAAAQPVRHAPGKAVLCPNCLAKGYAICMPDETQTTAASEEAHGA